MTLHDSSAPAPTRRAIFGIGLARLAMLLGVLCAAAALLCGPGYRFGWWPLGVGIQTLRWAATSAFAGAAIALLALMLLRSGGRRGSRRLAVGALLVNLLVAVPPALYYRSASGLPPIHDISTDTVDPPRFVAIAALRKDAPNGIEYPPANAALQQRAYPSIKTFTVATDPPKTFDRAARAATAMGWQIVTIAPDELRIEATATTWLFGFKDDVVIRVAPAEQGSKLDVRSLSRVGRGDFGTNAKRIRAYLDEFVASAQ